ncbi:hypothetical protein MTY66_17760 [Mycolicibacterium sp. TY66]|nr:hypothetical protein MTY66_17760 [Mycolicibacterium sp. TY66]BCJ82185.1 hypothetical protein MTY81_35580 [Mycolicibacterium sp. TY81]
MYALGNERFVMYRREIARVGQNSQMSRVRLAPTTWAKVGAWQLVSQWGDAHMPKQYRMHRLARMALLVIASVSVGAGVGAAVAAVLSQRGPNPAGHGLT